MISTLSINRIWFKSHQNQKSQQLHQGEAGRWAYRVTVRSVRRSASRHTHEGRERQNLQQYYIQVRYW